MKSLHLLCNAHLDPVWQWEWEEGAAAAVSTFRAAVEFCEEYDGFVFNHNEALLYLWIEEYEPELFVRIQGLVKQGKWHILGGWYLQPDCNMPSGESFVRQMLSGRTYFAEQFGVRPTTAINFDSFGHSKGLVQIIQQAGYDSYVFMRPDSFPELPGQDFNWEGFNGSKLTAHKVKDGYNTLLGKSVEKIKHHMEQLGDQPVGLVLWGVGNHGGGPSRQDLGHIAELMKADTGFDIRHSTPEAYFKELLTKVELPSFDGDLNPRFVGCYTSMIRIKQKHRKLESELFMTEKMLSAAALNGLLAYPYKEMYEALRDLMTAQFHDILPGTSVQPAEEASIRTLDHGLEIVARMKARAFFALAKGQPKAQLKEYPILVFNPHPFPIETTVECEFMLEDQNWNEEFSLPVVYRGGQQVPSQPEKELSNLNLDWRKRTVFKAVLEPMTMNRFDCRLEMIPERPAVALLPEGGNWIFRSERLEVIINGSTGLIDSYRVDGVSYLKLSACKPIVVTDNEDPWRMDVNRFDSVEGEFELMNPRNGTTFSGVKQSELASVRVVEDGPVRTVIEALLSYEDSVICQTYKLPKQGTEVEIHVRVYWNEKDKMLKWSVPTLLEEAAYVGQTAYGISELKRNGDEVVAQRWVAAQEQSANDRTARAVTLINDSVYGSDYQAGEIRLSLLRGAGYCAHPIGERPILPQDRFLPRMDQGERQFTFWLNAGVAENRLAAIETEALVHHEKPYALSFFPSGEGTQMQCPFQLEASSVQLTAFKRAENGDGYILRLFESSGRGETAKLYFPENNLHKEIKFNGFEIVTLRYRKETGEAVLESLMEGY